jgi:dUTP pyrophosphatase
MEIKFKKMTGNEKSPYRANSGDAGYDLYVHSIELRNDGMQVCYHTGIAVEIPEGYVGLLYMRSSAVHKSCRMANATGVVDSGYRGEITAVFDILNPSDLYKVGDRCCQLVIMHVPEVEYVEVEALADSQRGNKGYGSSGN